MLCIRDKADFHAAIDALGENDIALLLIRGNQGDNRHLQISSYGQGSETEFLGLFGYGSVILHRTYFGGDDG